MTMTRKDYILIAKAIHNATDLDDLVDILSVELKVDNRHFDADKFQAAAKK